MISSPDNEKDAKTPRPSDPFRCFVVYEKPTDFPTEYVCRVQKIIDGQVVKTSGLFARGPSLESVRAQIPGWTVRAERGPNDDPAIVEVWL